MTETPTRLSLQALREAGYRVEVVERWNAQSRTRHDLFGFVDVLAVGHGETVAVQTTTRGNVSSRVRKIRDECADELADVVEAGWRVVVHGWDQPGGKYTEYRVRTVEVEA